MTTWFTRVAVGAFALVALSFSSCKKDETQVVAKNVAAPSLMSSTATPDLVLTATNSSATAATFTYTAADFGYAAAVTYSLQIDKKGGNFTNPQTFNGGTTAGTITLTKAQLANAFFTLGVVSGTTAQVDTRVVALLTTTASVSTPTQASSVVTLTGTPTVAPPACTPNTTGRTWSLIGPAGTDWNTDRALTYDCYTQTFKATMSLNVGEFKFRANNDWTVNFGTAGNTSAITLGSLAQGIPLVNNNNNLQIPTAGTYTITLAPSADGTTATVTIK